MEKINLLDLDNDVLNIIGDYVKADNIERMKIIKFIADEIEQIKSDAKKEKKKLTKHILCAANALMFIYVFIINFMLIITNVIGEFIMKLEILNFYQYMRNI